MLELIKNTPEGKLRSLGTVFLIIGFLIIWYIKSQMRSLKKILFLFVILNFSARSANDSGIGFALTIEELKIINKNNIFLRLVI